MSESGEQSEGAERNEEPTQRRLEQAREKGDIAKSNDITTAASYVGLLIVFWGAGAVVLSAAENGQAFLESAPFIRSIYPSIPTQSLLTKPIAMLLGLLLVPAVLVILSLIAQRAIIFTPDKLIPKLSRISLIANAKQKFGMMGIIEFLKSLLKMIISASVLVVFLTYRSDQLVVVMELEPKQGVLLIAQLLAEFFFIITLAVAAIGAVDLILQKQALVRRNRMSRQDMKEETKESEGDPHTKAQRRQRGQEIAMNQMLAEVKNAAVVIVNPTHYSVALKWERGSKDAPIVVAKGVNELALKIRESAGKNGVPVYSDPPTARAIHAVVDIGQPIARGQFEAVAAAIRFSEAMRKRAKQR